MPVQVILVIVVFLLFIVSYIIGIILLIIELKNGYVLSALICSLLLILLGPIGLVIFLFLRKPLQAAKHQDTSDISDWWDSGS